MRDDVWKLPLPQAAKAYARRKGLRSMMRQPDDFIKVNAMLTNPGKPNKFKNYDAVGKVPHAMKGGKSKKAKGPKYEAMVKSTADQLVEKLLE